METTKQNIITFLQRKILNYDDMAETYWEAGNQRMARELEDKSAIYEDLLAEIDRNFED